MRRRETAVIAALLAVACAASQSSADPLDVNKLLICQRQLAIQGARFARTVIKNSLKCTNEIVECQINCDEGVYGPSCHTSPPPCCDSDDPESNAEFGECMTDAEANCVKLEEKTDAAEVRKGTNITGACDELSVDQLCGAATPGLNFAALNAGCEALIPGYECSLQGIIDCIGGPVQQSMSEQLAVLLDPRATEALSAAPTLDPSVLSGVARTRKITGSLAAGKVDVWSIDGAADDLIEVKVKTRDDNAGFSSLEPVLTYLAQDATTPVANTNVAQIPCQPSTCGATCPSLKRRFPFTGTFYLAVRAATANGCGAGTYRLVVTTPGGQTPVLVADDVDP
jgi:hypothetical protein